MIDLTFVAFINSFVIASVYQCNCNDNFRPASPKSRKKLNSTDSPQNGATNLLEVKEKSPTDFYSQAEDRRSAPSSVTTTPVASRRTPVKARDVRDLETELFYSREVILQK